MSSHTLPGSALTMLLAQQPPFIPVPAEVMTATVELPPGDPGTPPRRDSGPVFGYMLEGEMTFELKGEPERVIRAGEAFWEQAVTSSTTRRRIIAATRGAGSSWS